jgi:hypothetical protein
MNGCKRESGNQVKVDSMAIVLAKCQAQKTVKMKMAHLYSTVYSNWANSRFYGYSSCKMKMASAYSMKPL